MDTALGTPSSMRQQNIKADFPHKKIGDKVVFQRLTKNREVKFPILPDYRSDKHPLQRIGFLLLLVTFERTLSNNRADRVKFENWILLTPFGIRDGYFSG